MIAPIESLPPGTRPRVALDANPANDASKPSPPAATEMYMQSAKRWIGEHPHAAIASSIAIGALLGWIVKRRLPS